MGNPDQKNSSVYEEEMELAKKRRNYLGSYGTRFIAVESNVVICRDDMPTIIIPRADLLNYAKKVSGMILPHEALTKS